MSAPADAVPIWRERYPSVRAALRAARQAVAAGGSIYAGCGDYTLTDGRMIAVALVPADGGGSLLGSARQWAYYGTEAGHSRWRPLRCAR